jgi:hypothetical protein
MFDPRSYFLDNASDYASVFQQSLISHPTAKQFVVVPGRTEKTYSFVPTHLKRLLPNNCSKILTVNRPTGAITTEDLKTYLGTVALLALTSQSKAESLTQAIHRATDETILRTVFKDVVDLMDKAEKEAPGAIGRIKRYYADMHDYYFSQLENGRQDAKKQCADLDITVSDNKRDVGVALSGQLLDTDSEPVILDWLGLADKDINNLPDAVYTNALLKVDKLTIGIRRLAGAVRSAKLYDDYRRHTMELMRLEHEIAFEAKCQQEMEKEMDLIEEKLMRALGQMNRTMSDIKNIAEDEENEKEEDDA